MVDAVPGKVFTGTVKFISPFGEKSGNVIKFSVTIDMDPSDVELRGGLNATADIIIYSAQDVLLVPVSFVSTDAGGSMVMVINQETGKAEPRKVVIGKQDLQYVEILEGLNEGDKLTVPDNFVIPVNGNGAPPVATGGSMRMLR